MARPNKPPVPTIGGALQDLLEKAIPDPVTPPDLADARPPTEDAEGRGQCTQCQTWVPFPDLNAVASGYLCTACLRARRRPEDLPPVPEGVKIGIKGGRWWVIALAALVIGLVIGLMARG